MRGDWPQMYTQNSAICNNFTTMQHTFLIFTTIICYVSARVDLMHNIKCPIDV